VLLDDPTTMATLKWFLRWYRRRAVKTKVLIALLILVTILGCFGALSPPSGVQRRARSADLSLPLSARLVRPIGVGLGLFILGSASIEGRG
jgi:hypothetical protein